MHEATYGVWLGGQRAGLLHQRGDYTWFDFDQDYLDDPGRPVLGLWFEDKALRKPYASHMRLPPWFSNLLPEGRLRDWIADDRGVSSDREMELLAQVGHDLPGAVRIMPEDAVPSEIPVDEASSVEVGPPDAGRWRFSLAGVRLKFSMVEDNGRLALPAYGEGGDWIVKLPDQVYSHVPRNEFAMMSLAAAVGIDVPEIRLVHRDETSGLPANVWPGEEEVAYAIRRFDRGASRKLVHIEDFAQVRNFYSQDKYSGSYETVASLAYRGHDLNSLREFARRLAFMVLIANGDGHLKNWSLLYRDVRIPTLAPAYDLVSTDLYREGDRPEELALKFHGTKQFDRVTLASFARLQAKLGARDASLPDVVADVVTRTVREWPGIADGLSDVPMLAAGIGKTIETAARTLTTGR